MKIKTSLAAAAVFGALGCATVQVPSEKFEQSQASIRSAEELGADTVPAAKLHLQLAKDQEDQAKKLAANGDGNAVLLLARANSDAELALALAREAATNKDAGKAAEDLKAVQARPSP